jgi:hypothetical protein
MRRSTITPTFVNVIPDQLENGILYICERYRTAAHKCCCGCGEEVITPLTPADWSIRKEGNAVSLTPSIGNWSFTCKSHYWIRRNRVIWAGHYSQRQIDRVKARDKSDKEACIAAINLQKDQHEKTISIIAKFWHSLMSWWKF